MDIDFTHASIRKEGTLFGSVVTVKNKDYEIEIKINDQDFLNSLRNSLIDYAKNKIEDMKNEKSNTAQTSSC